ncbi:GL16145 [Drosophila persimilis]|uniref:GL16145 n=1 Tax=Drosophila persimilis TaxID=7234 RepID=B4H5G8_DROPE|nr:GL16145 [Drosophila persimilis]
MSLPMAQYLVLFAGAALLLPTAWGYQEEMRYPCAFIDTANITGSFGTDGSYVHNWTVIPRNLVAAYDFVIENGIRVPAAKHLRGCVCKLKPCVRFCCPEGEIYDLERRQCLTPSIDHQPPPGQTHFEVQMLNGSLQELELRSRFSIYVDTPCGHMKPVTKGSEYVHWTLHEPPARTVPPPCPTVPHGPKPARDMQTCRRSQNAKRREETKDTIEATTTIRQAPSSTSAPATTKNAGQTRMHRERVEMIDRQVTLEVTWDA